MRRLPSFFITAIALAPLGAFAQRSEAEVRAFYTKVDAAIVTGLASHDGRAALAMTDRVLAQDFVSTMNSRVETRAEYLRDMKAVFTMKNAPRLSMRVLQVKPSTVSGKKALLIDTEVTVQGGGGSGEKAFIFRLQSRDTWVQTPKGYRWTRNEARPPKPR